MTASLSDAVVVIGTTLAATLLLLLISGQLHDTTAGNLISRSAAPALQPTATRAPTPAQSLLGHMTPSPQPVPSRAAPSAPGENETDTSITDDATIQAVIDKKFQDNPDLADITVNVSGGRVTLVGTVASDEAKEKVAKLVRTVKGVKQIDNQIAVISQD